ncbi:MAG: phage protease [Lentisphaerota bacterium]
MRPSRFLGLANEDGGFDNESTPFSVDTDGKLVIPYGDYWHEEKKVVQRVDKVAGEALANQISSLKGKLHKLFIGYPVYIGHPDVPDLASKYPDNKSYAWIQNVRALENSMEIDVDWNEPGKVLLANRHFGWFSPYWFGEDLPKENGKRVARPIRMASIGLTNKPQIGVLRLPNEQTQKEDSDMELLKKLLALLGLPETATEADLETEMKRLMTTVGQLKDELEKSATVEAVPEETKPAIANEASPVARTALIITTLSGVCKESKQKLQALENEKTTLTATIQSGVVALANERKARAELLVVQAVKEGRITPAAKDQWLQDLIKDFDGKAVALANEKGAMKTTSATNGLGKRTSDESTKRSQVLALVNEKLDEMKWGEDRYFDAHMLVKKAHPEMFQETASATK